MEEGGTPIRGHKRAALLRNRNRLPVIVRHNGGGERGRTGRRRRMAAAEGAAESIVPLSVIAELPCIYVRRNANRACTRSRVHDLA